MILCSSGAREAGRYCYDQSTRGVYYAFCKRTPSQYIPCQAE